MNDYCDMLIDEIEYLLENDKFTNEPEWLRKMINSEEFRIKHV